MTRLRFFRSFFAVFVLVIFLQPVNSLNKCKEPSVPLKNIVAEPKKYLGKTVFIEGEFYSFSTLALDYNRAMRSSKDFIGIVLARPDKKEIPLVELKLAAPLKMFKETSLNVEHGNRVTLKAKVFAVALGEPWLDVEEIEVNG